MWVKTYMRRTINSEAVAVDKKERVFEIGTHEMVSIPASWRPKRIGGGAYDYERNSNLEIVIGQGPRMTKSARETTLT